MVGEVYLADDESTTRKRSSTFEEKRECSPRENPGYAYMSCSQLKHVCSPA